MVNFVVYTAVFGNYTQRIYDAPSGNSLVDYICITNNPNLTAKGWKIHVVDETGMDPICLNRKYKILNHIYFPEYKWSLYVDANIEIKSNPFSLFKKYIDSGCSFFVPFHDRRKCIYEEAIECIALGRGNAFEIIKQVRGYNAKGMPHNHGLTENGILLRNNHDPETSVIMDAWWAEFTKHKSYRDQLSLPYVLWLNSSKIFSLSETARNRNPFFLYHPHKVTEDTCFFNKFSFYSKKLIKKAFAFTMVRFPTISRK